MTRLIEMYNRLKDQPSDINEHFPTLKKYATGCSHITEMGVRDVVSTFALMSGRPKRMISYDLGRSGNVDFAAGIAKEEGIDWIFVQGDVLRQNIESTDLLFIDTKHTYRQLRRELALHAANVVKWIVFHDTESFGKKDEFPEKSPKQGLATAIEEFLEDHPEWELEKKFKNNNGLTILKRVAKTPARPRVSIVIPTMNHLEDCLKPCIESIQKFTDMDQVEVVVVANGCTDGTMKYMGALMKKHPKQFRMVWIKKPNGYTASVNRGIEAAKGEHVVLLNNDTVLLGQAKNDWIRMLIEPLEQDRDIAITGPMRSGNAESGRSFLIFFCVAMRRDLFRELGLLDEVFNPGFGEDVDFCIRAQDSGYKIVQVPDEKFEIIHDKGHAIHVSGFPIWHAGEKTLDDDPKAYGKLIEKNSAILKKRYGTPEPAPQKVSPQKASKKKDALVFDCFPFFNELDVLEIRLRELSPVVDRFVLVESRLTHSGKPKPLYYEKNKKRFAEWADKIEHVVCDFPAGDTWFRERFQREAIMDGLARIQPKDSDIVIVSDADEIPNADSVREYIQGPERDIAFCRQYLSYYFLNCRKIGEWYGSRITTFGIVKKIGAHAVRLHDGRRRLPHVGWHFSFLTGDSAERVREKIEAFGHQELNVPQWTGKAHLDKCLKEGLDMFGRKEEQFRFIAVDSSFPACVAKDPAKWDQLIHSDKEERGKKRSIRVPARKDEKKGKAPKVKKAAAPGNQYHTAPEPRIGNYIGPKDDAAAPLPPQTKDAAGAQTFVDVTATISTKNRYDTTLPSALISIAMQTVRVKKIIVYDDGDRKDLREMPWYKQFMLMLSIKGIGFYVAFGEGKGQVKNHQRATIECETEWVWRLDDDNIAEPDVLEKLLRAATPTTGAIGGLVLDPSSTGVSEIASNKIEDIYLGMNQQWFMNTKGLQEVDHLYSTFIYRRSAALHGYHKDLSPVGHREETMFTHTMKILGHQVWLEPSAVTWHYRAAVGGIRQNTDRWMWDHDEKIFQDYLRKSGVTPRQIKLVVLDNGMGDHWAFKPLIPELKKRYGAGLVMATCYPEVFKNSGVKQISIAEAKMMCDIEPLNVYRFMAEHRWDKPLVEAFRELYLGGES